MIETKILAQGHKHVSYSGARTHSSQSSTPESYTLLLDHARSQIIILIIIVTNLCKLQLPGAVFWNNTSKFYWSVPTVTLVWF